MKEYVYCLSGSMKNESNSLFRVDFLIALLMFRVVVNFELYAGHRWPTKTFPGVLWSQEKNIP